MDASELVRAFASALRSRSNFRAMSPKSWLSENRPRFEVLLRFESAVDVAKANRASVCLETQRTVMEKAPWLKNVQVLHRSFKWCEHFMMRFTVDASVLSDQKSEFPDASFFERFLQEKEETRADALLRLEETARRVADEISRHVVSRVWVQRSLYQDYWTCRMDVGFVLDSFGAFMSDAKNLPLIEQRLATCNPDWNNVTLRVYAETARLTFLLKTGGLTNVELDEIGRVI